MGQIETQASTNAQHWVGEYRAGRIDTSEFNQIVIDHGDMGDEYRAEFDAELASLGFPTSRGSLSS